MTKCKRDRTPMQATARGRNAIGLDLAPFTWTNCLPVQPVNKEPCKFCYMFTRVKRNANFKVYLMFRKLKSLHTLVQAFFCCASIVLTKMNK